MLVHVDPEDLPSDLIALHLGVAGEVSERRVNREGLPEDWADVPGHPACRELGDEWVESGASLLLRVPSAVVWEENNVLVNPRHAEAEKLQVVATRPFRFDPRLVG